MYLVTNQKIPDLIGFVLDRYFPPYFLSGYYFSYISVDLILGCLTTYVLCKINQIIHLYSM